MELHQLKYFLAVVDEGAFTSAAEACGITQPTLSQQIGKLEMELGLPLFHRLGRRVELTEAGQSLVPRADEILSSVREVPAIVRAASTEIGGRLCVGTVPTFAQFMLPKIIKTYLIENPQVDLIIHESNRTTLVNDTIRGRFDIVVLSRAIKDTHLHVEQLIREDFVLILPRDHRLADRKRIRMADLSNERFVLLDQAAGLPNLIQEFCREHGFDPSIACRTSQLATVQAMVSAGLGIAFVPRMAAPFGKDRSQVVKEIFGPKPTRTITIAWHRRRFQTPAAREFVQQLRSGVCENK